MVRIGLQQHSDCRVCDTDIVSSEQLTSSRTAITGIRANHLRKDVIDKGEIPSLKPTHTLQFIEAVSLDGEL